MKNWLLLQRWLKNVVLLEGLIHGSCVSGPLKTNPSFKMKNYCAFFLAIRCYYRRSKLPSITHNNAHPRLDFQFRSHHLSRYHMPDFIFPFFPDLIRKHIIQSVSKKLLEKLNVKNLGKKHAFEALLCCHDHRLLLKKLSLWWTTSWKSVVCKQLYESLLFHFLCVVETILKEELLKAPFHLLFYFKGWKWNYRLAMKIDDFSPLLNCWVCGLAWNSKFDILDGKSGIYMFDGICFPILFSWIFRSSLSTVSTCCVSKLLSF